ncbi:MAG: hypothetical protein CM15mP115_05490 [Alphaproteobacteria bacterium]|nr:MAG: hypothetical protein CM15mP115_05490 [Alphaproteobacteria bacterium]
MSLYYEDFPADDGAEPQLPPLLTAVKVPSGQNVMAKALASAQRPRSERSSMARTPMSPISRWCSVLRCRCARPDRCYMR